MKPSIKLLSKGRQVTMTDELLGYVLVEVTARLTEQSAEPTFESLDDIIWQQWEKLKEAKLENRD